MVKVITILVLSFTIIISAQGEKPKELVKATIRVVKKDNIVNVYAKAINNSNINQETLSYTLFLLKNDEQNNITKNIQKGKFSLLENEIKLLSKQQLNINDKGIIKAYLYINNKHKLISKDSVKITLLDKKYSNDNIDEVNIELTGLVIENVMTKLGKDFYDSFNQINQLNGINYPFIIIIDEKPGIGGKNSKINIKVNDEAIYQFITQPSEEYLYNNAVEANKSVYKYHIKNKLLQQKERTY